MLAAKFKWSPAAKGRIPAAFRANYPGSEERIVTPDNFENFVLTDKNELAEKLTAPPES